MSKPVQLTELERDHIVESIQEALADSSGERDYYGALSQDTLDALKESLEILGVKDESDD